MAIKKTSKSDNHNNEFRAKKILKNPIKFKLQLNEEQKKAKAKILLNTLTLLTGGAGSGKTLLACQIALDGLFRNEYSKIIITRPTVSKEDIGFLPGDLREKMDPWVQPIYQNMFLLYDKIKIEKYIDSGQIEIVPVSFMRGRTFTDSCLITGESILTKNGYIKIEDIYVDATNNIFHKVLTYNEKLNINEYKLLDAITPGRVSEYIQVEMEDGTITNVSPNHKFYTTDGLKEAQDLRPNDEIISLIL